MFDQYTIERMDDQKVPEILLSANNNQEIPDDLVFQVQACSRCWPNGVRVDGGVI